MSDFRILEERFWVAPQMDPGDIKMAAEQGFDMIICNRPDGEVSGQLPMAKLEAEAKTHNIRFMAAPFAGPPPKAAVQILKDALNGNESKVLAYCRTGTRSCLVWSRLQFEAGKMSRNEIIEKGAAAGYDIAAFVNQL